MTRNQNYDLPNLRAIREKSVDEVLLVIAIVTVPAVLASWARAFEIGLQPILYFHALMGVVLTVVGFLRKRIKYGVKLLSSSLLSAELR